MAGSIHVRGAREHNLKNVDVVIPRDRLTVITGLSGSGKSSLAFDTIYAEGQRRYVESLSAYARQFLELMGKPDVDCIEGLSPAISIEQKTTSRNPRSTVGTVTEIHDYMRLLWARTGVPYSPATGPADRGADRVADGRPRAGDAGGHAPAAARPGGARPQGRVPQGTGGTAAPRLHPREGRRHAVRDRRGAVAQPQDQARDRGRGGPHRGARRHRAAACRQLRDRARAVGWRRLRRERRSGGERTVFSSRFACPVSGFSIEEIEPRLFSFNSPHGACPACDGLGVESFFDPALVVPDERLSLAERRGHAVDRRAEPLLRPDAAEPGAPLQGDARATPGRICRRRCAMRS